MQTVNQSALVGPNGRAQSKQQLTFAALYVLSHSVQSQLIQDFFCRAEAQSTGEEVAQEVHYKGNQTRCNKHNH